MNLNYLSDILTVLILCRDSFCFPPSAVVIELLLDDLAQIIDVDSRPQDLTDPNEDSHILIF